MQPRVAGLPVDVVAYEPVGQELLGATLPKLEFRNAQLQGLQVKVADRYGSFNHLQKERTKLPAGALSAMAENELYSRLTWFIVHNAGTTPCKLLCDKSSSSNWLLLQEVGMVPVI